LLRTSSGNDIQQNLFPLQIEIIRKNGFGFWIFSVWSYILATIDMSATTRKATPVHSRSPVRKYTIAATIIAGIRTKNSFIRIIIIRPTMTRAISKGMFNQLRFKLLRIEYITAINIAKFMS